MSHIELLVPFGLPPAELAGDLLRELQLPALSMLLARATLQPAVADTAVDPLEDGFARSLPHERWLAERFGMGEALLAGGSPPVAAPLMQSLGMAPDDGHWFIAQPVHFHIARDHLVLTDPRQLALSDADSRALFDTALPVFDAAGLSLRYGGAAYWFVWADRHRDLQTATPDATCGHNIDIWMPQGESARAWRKLQNEVQMDWHEHAINEARVAAGLNPVNSLWIWGGSDSKPDQPGTGAEALYGFEDWFAAFTAAAASHRAEGHAAQLLADPAPRRLLLLDGLIGPALGADWSTWLHQLTQYEATWFAPLLAALTQGKFGRVSLTLSHGTRLQQWSASRTSLKKFWCKPALTRLRA